MIISIGIALLFTLLIETTVFLIIAIWWKYDVQNFSSKRIIYASIKASGITLPILHLTLRVLGASVTQVLIWEIIVVFVEAIIYKNFFRIKYQQAFFIALLANVASFWFGIVAL